MTIKGLIFDFDGLIIDTEVAEYEAWLAIFKEYGVPLPLDILNKSIGVPNDDFDLSLYLKNQIDQPINPTEIRNLQHQYVVSKVNEMPPMPGIKNILYEGVQSGLMNAVASSSSCSWVSGHLTRLGLSHYFATICTREDVRNAKPAPDLFLLACERLEIDPSEAIVFEDSPNGITAAKMAGCNCVCVPNKVTSRLPISHADAIISSLETIALNQILGQFNDMKIRSNSLA